MKSIAVLMLVYKNDRLDNVKASLNSLYEQTYDWIDIYIQEDGVIDNCVHDFLLRELSENRISYLGFRNEHKGIAYSRNELLKVSFPKGYQYIATMDSDDISLANRIEKQFSFMEKNKYIDVCGTYIEEFGDGIDYNKVVTYPTTHSEMFAFFKKRVPLANVTSLFRVSFFHKAGLYEIEGHINNEDTLMWMKGFMNDCKFANIDYIGVKVRVSRDFFSRRSGRKKILSDFNNRITVIRNLNYGFSSYFYAFSIAIINIMPSTIKKYTYRYFR